MNKSEEILKELEGISPLLAEMEKINVFKVPEGYFVDLDVRIAAYAILSDTSVTDNISKRNLQKVPEGYFDTLSDSILNKIKIAYPESASEELQKLSGTLFSLKDTNVFSVPSGYFESFENELLRKINQEEPARIISINKRSSWLRYAVAAVITGAIAFTSVEIFTNKKNADSSNSMAVTETIKNSFQYKNADEVNEGIARLSDADIVKYLEKNGNVMDNAVLLNDADVSEMPDQTDYLQDANALNTYLNKIGAKNN
ncbi:MAG: hypothetical protein M3139_01320 [Bacteroidota bacterium]|nr:hypothetical protein [Bacteroidota bacterium]